MLNDKKKLGDFWMIGFNLGSPQFILVLESSAFLLHSNTELDFHCLCLRLSNDCFLVQLKKVNLHVYLGHFYFLIFIDLCFLADTLPFCLTFKLDRNLVSLAVFQTGFSSTL